MRFKAQLRAGVAAICIASLIAPAGLAATGEGAVAAQGPITVKVAQGKDLSRIEFRAGGKISIRRDGQTVVVHFSRYAKPDMTRLRVDPPRWLKSGQDAKAGGGLDITLTLDDGADASVGQADGATYVNLFAKKSVEGGPPVPAAPAAPVAPTVAQAPPPHPNAAPASGVVKMQAEMNSGHVLLHFPWKAPLGAAVFRRGAAIWVVFDTAAKLDLSGAPHGFRQATGFRAVQGPDYSAVRIDAPPDITATATAEGANWTISLAANQTQTGDAVKINRDGTSVSAGLSVAMAGSTKVVWLDDPVVGDRIAAVTALGPAKGMPSRHAFVDLTLLASPQGLAIEPARQDLLVTSDGDVVNITRPNGLSLSSHSDVAGAALAAPVSAQLAAPQPASMPGLVEFDEWSKVGGDGFMGRYAALQRAAANEIQTAKDTSVSARMALARFLVGSQLAFEAIGVLDMTAKSNQSVLGEAEFRGLRGAAKAMAGRYKEAQADLTTPVIADDPASAVWRGYVSEKLGDMADAETQFAAGARALYGFAPAWRARFSRAAAEASLAQGHFLPAEVDIDDALRNKLDPDEELATRLIQAKVFEARGQKARALAVYQAISYASPDFLSAPAQLRATRLMFEEGKISPIEAANRLDGLRYRWRGDATELDTIRALGQIYLNLGRYREALDALRSAGKRLPDLPQAVQLQSDLNSAFRALFLDGQADGLQPIQALALFYDFKELTPVGADGDQMVRRLARRLVDVDLLSQAAELLKYQAEHRLDGVPRAEVATDLAMIQLMNRQPEAALDALNSSRSTLLPATLTAQRRVIEGRAWLALGQYDHALEILETDKSGDAESVRAEVAWKKHDWNTAAVDFERRLGDRWKNPTPLTPEEESALLRAGVAMSLAGDEGGLTRLRGHYQGFINGSHSPESLRVALSGLSGNQLSGADFAKAAAENDSFASWVQAMKQRLRQTQAAASTPPRG